MIWCYNMDFTYLSAKSIFYTRIKHVDVDYHFVNDRVAKKTIQIHFISFKCSYKTSLHFFFLPFLDQASG